MANFDPPKNRFWMESNPRFFNYSTEKKKPTQEERRRCEARRKVELIEMARELGEELMEVWE